MISIWALTHGINKVTLPNKWGRVSASRDLNLIKLCNYSLSKKKKTNLINTNELAGPQVFCRSEGTLNQRGLWCKRYKGRNNWQMVQLSASQRLHTGLYGNYQQGWIASFIISIIKQSFSITKAISSLSQKCQQP